MRLKEENVMANILLNKLRSFQVRGDSGGTGKEEKILYGRPEEK